MDIRQHLPSRERGVALITVLGILFALALIALAAVQTADTDMTIAGNKTVKTKAFLAAEAGLARTSYILGSNPKQTDADTLIPMINSDTLLPNSHFRVAMDTTLPFRRVISLGSSDPGECAIQVTYKYRLNPYNIWNNTIFAGHGQNGIAIKGNVGIHGPVHILGDGEPFTDSNGNGVWDPGEPYRDANHDGTYDAPLKPSEAALDMSGTSSITNNYLGMPAELATRVPALQTTSYAGETVQTMDAELRVRHGSVIIDGNATVGKPNVSGGTPAVKETMDGVYVSDGFQGSQASSSVYSDNGYESKYDLDELKMEMPNLDDPYTDKFGASYPTYMDYLKANALIIPGNLTLNYGSSLSYISSPKGSIGLDASGNLTMSGIVYVAGEIEIQGSGPIKYDGRFTLVSEGNVNINTSFYSKDVFPTNDVAGIIAHKKIQLGTGGGASHLNLAGAFFAQEEVVNGKQNDLVGTIVSNYFGMSQVPNLYQVPTLGKNLPPGMPGADDVYIYAWWLVPRSWTQLN